MYRSAGKSILSALTWSQRSASNAVVIFRPEFCYALNKRSVPVRNGSHTRSDGRSAKGASRVIAKVVSDGGPRCRFLSFARDALIARSPSARRRGLKTGELLNVLIKRHSLRGVAGR